jgi:hypothetical protein
MLTIFSPLFLDVDMVLVKNPVRVNLQQKIRTMALQEEE